MSNPEDLVTFMPPKELFQFGVDKIDQVVDEPQYIPQLEKIMSPPEGGIYAYHKGYAFPEKGWPYPEAISAVNSVKRYLIGYVRFIAKNPIIIVSMLFFRTQMAIFEEFCKFGKMVLKPHMLKDRYYMDFSKQIYKFVHDFMGEIGFTRPDRTYWIGYTFAWIVQTILEYDRAYRYRIEDIFSETNVDRLLKSPIREIHRLMDIFKSREPKEHLQEKFLSIAKILSYALLIPKYRRAFRKALSGIEFKHLQFDDADRYHVLPLHGYLFMGIQPETRYEAFVQYHNGKPPMLHYIKGKTDAVTFERTTDATA